MAIRQIIPLTASTLQFNSNVGFELSMTTQGVSGGYITLLARYRMFVCLTSKFEKK